MTPAFGKPPRPAGTKQRPGYGLWERRANRYQRALVAAYDSWSVAARRTLHASLARGGTPAQLAATLAASMADLDERLAAVVRRAVVDSARGAVGPLAWARPEVRQTARGLLAGSLLQVHQALVPGIGKTLGDRLRTGKVILTRAGLKEAFDALRYRPANYAGAAWVATFEAIRTEGRQRERERGALGLPAERVRWELDPQAVHCQPGEPGFWDCPSLAGEYASWDHLPTVPAGRTRCRGNCRCKLLVLINGEWRRGYGG